jgi:hypothetical protein
VKADLGVRELELDTIALIARARGLEQVPSGLRHIGSFVSGSTYGIRPIG